MLKLLNKICRYFYRPSSKDAQTEAFQLDAQSQAFQLAEVREHPSAIQDIEKPSEQVQLAAVTRYGLAIKFIEEPSEEVQRAAVRENGNAILFIKEPSEVVMFEAVRHDPYAIKFIKEPSEAVQRAAVRENGDAIKFIKEPSEAVKLVAVKQDPYAVKRIEKPYEFLDLTNPSYTIKRNEERNEKEKEFDEDVKYFFPPLGDESREEAVLLLKDYGHSALNLLKKVVEKCLKIVSIVSSTLIYASDRSYYAEDLGLAILLTAAEVVEESSNKDELLSSIKTMDTNIKKLYTRLESFITYAKDIEFKYDDLYVNRAHLEDKIETAWQNIINSFYFYHSSQAEFFNNISEKIMLHNNEIILAYTEENRPKFSIEKLPFNHINQTKYTTARIQIDMLNQVLLMLKEFITSFMVKRIYIPLEGLGGGVISEKRLVYLTFSLIKNAAKHGIVNHENISISYPVSRLVGDYLRKGNPG